MDAPYADAHVHLQEEVLEGHAEGAIERALAAGVRLMVCNGTHPGDWGRTRELAERYESVAPAFGLHPWFVREAPQGWETLLREHLESVPSTVGEIGLDGLRKSVAFETQLEAFRCQFELAIDLGRAVTIHCVKAWGPLLSELRARRGALPTTVIHAFAGSGEVLRELVGLGCWVSLGPSSLYDAHTRAREAARLAPLERVLVETDSPALLPPEEFRTHVIDGPDGETWNEPANLPAVLRGLAAIRGEAEEALARAAWENTVRVFGAPG